MRLGDRRSSANACFSETGPRLGRRSSLRLTPAMAAGVTDRLWSLEDLYDAVME